MLAGTGGPAEEASIFLFLFQYQEMGLVLEEGSQAQRGSETCPVQSQQPEAARLGLSPAPGPCGSTSGVSLEMCPRELGPEVLTVASSLCWVAVLRERRRGVLSV